MPLDTQVRLLQIANLLIWITAIVIGLRGLL